jgi:hypothetical protein
MHRLIGRQLGFDHSAWRRQPEFVDDLGEYGFERLFAIPFQGDSASEAAAREIQLRPRCLDSRRRISIADGFRRDARESRV